MKAYVKISSDGGQWPSWRVYVAVGERWDSTYCATKWGAKWTARRMARRLRKPLPLPVEYELDT